MPFNTSIPAQAGACAALDDRDFFKQTLRTVHEGLDFLYAELSKIGIRYFPTQANFFLIDLQRNADEIFQALLRQGVIVRSMTSYGFPEYIRINAGTMAENQRFIRALNQVLA
jgi:histidinol-phosphate aminotransferase